MLRTYEGGCHCGRIRFRIQADLAPPAIGECNCSICAKKGILHITVAPENFELLCGEGEMTTYRFNTGTAQHTFCRTCGIYTHHKRRSNPNELGVNVACLEGVSPFDFSELVVYDGDRHPADNAEHRTFVAGTLRFEPADGS
jgi:hypothetical protein